MPLPVDSSTEAESSTRLILSNKTSSAAIATSATIITPNIMSSTDPLVSQTQVPLTTVNTSVQSPSLPSTTSVQSLLLPSTTSSPLVIAPKPLSTTVIPSISLSVSPTDTTTAPLLLPPSNTRTKSSLPPIFTTSVVIGGVSTPIPLPDVPSTGVINQLPNQSPSQSPAPGLRKPGGSNVGGIAGGISAIVICGFLGLVIWRWAVRRRLNRTRRLSFGPHGNGIDASKGNVLVSSVACMPAESISIGESTYETEDYLPPPRSRYFQPTVDTGRMLLRPIPSIAEVSERDSWDLEKAVNKATLPVVSESRKDPFDDSHDVEKGTLLKEPPKETHPAERKRPPPLVIDERSRPRHQRHTRSRSSSSIREQRPASSWENLNGPITTQYQPYRPRSYNRQIGSRQDHYGYPNNHPYRNAPVDPRRMHSVQRKRRTTSLGGVGDGRYPHNPVLDGPAWRPTGPRSAPPTRRPSNGYGNNAQFSVNHPGMGQIALSRKESTGSLRERPSPELWNRPDISHPLHLTQSNSRTRRSPSAERSLDNSFSTAWGSVSNYVQGTSPSGDTARNF